MVRGDNVSPIVRADPGPPSFCPECGQPLTLAVPASTRDRKGGIPWRGWVLVVVGLYLSAVFGLDSWHGGWMIQSASACPGEERSNGCMALPRDLALAFAAGRASTGATFAARAAEIQFGRDVRFAIVGLAGLLVGLGAIVVHARPARAGAFGPALWIVVERLVALFYGEIAVVTAFRLVVAAPPGAPLSWYTIADVVDRTLTVFFALIGG